VDYVNAGAWAAGPDRIYRRLATAAVDAVRAAAGDLAGRTVLDAGAGAGAVAHVLRARGATVIAVDVSAAMVARAPAHRVIGDAERLPLRDGAVAASVAGLLLSHADSPVRVLRELARVTAAGGTVTVTAFPTGTMVAGGHPAKEVVDRVLDAAGYGAPAWYVAFKTEGEPRVGTPDRLAALAGRGGLHDVRVERRLVSLAGLDGTALAAWRLGMPPVAAWLSTVGPRRQDDIARAAASALAAVVADPPPLPLLVATGHRR
jgi:SAM-dependent methyltransferase